jgi:hypothetical protein
VLRVLVLGRMLPNLFFALGFLGLCVSFAFFAG